MNLIKAGVIIGLVFSRAVWGMAQYADDHHLTKFCIETVAENKTLVEGCVKKISGYLRPYYSSIPGATTTLFSRSSDGKIAIEWQTAPIPETGDKAMSLIWVAGLGVNSGDKKFALYVNGEKYLTFATKKAKTWQMRGAHGSRLQFITKYENENRDLFGIMILTLPAKQLVPGRPVRLKVTAESAHSSAWYMAFLDNKLLHRIQKTGKDGFWYKLTWNENENKALVNIPKSFSGKIFEFSDSNGHRFKKKLKEKNGTSTIVADLALNKLQFPLTLSLNGQTIDVLDSLSGQWHARELIDDGMIVYRDKSIRGTRHVLECSGSYFSDVVDELKMLSRSYFKNGTIHLATSSHQDIAWMDTPQQCMIDRDEKIITPALRMLARDSTYHYSAEQALMLHEYLARHPDRKNEILKYCLQGRLEWGANYNQPYEGMYSGESLVRGFYFGRKWLKKILPGYDSHLAWSVDVPGRTLQMAQILKKSGVDYLLISRQEKGFFYWQSPDGSRVGVHSPGHYHHASQFLRSDTEMAITETPRVVLAWEEPYKKYQLPPDVFVLYSTDMSSPKDFSGLFQKWNHLRLRTQGERKVIEPALPKFKYDLAEKSLQKIFDHNSVLPVIQGERPNVWLYIHGPTHHKAISASRQGAGLLTAAEMFSTIDAVLGHDFTKYPAKELTTAWEAHIYPDHGWGGKNGQVTDSVFQAKSEFARDVGAGILNKALKNIARQITFKKSSGQPLVVFNDLSWRRNAPVSCRVDFANGRAYDVRIVDGDGNTIDSELSNTTFYQDGSIKTAQVEFIAGEIPSIGYRTFYVQPLKKPSVNEKNTKTVKTFENQFYRITFADGGIKQIFDKKSNQDLFRTEKFLAGEIFTMQSVGNGAGEFAEVQQPAMDGFDKMSYHHPKWRMVGNGTIKTMFVLEQPFSHCTVRQMLTVYETIKRIDLDVDLLGWDGTKYREFRLAFPMNMNDAKVTYEVPFGKVTVGQDEIPGAAGERYVQPASQVHPREVQDWISASDDQFGFTMSSSVAVCDYIDPTDDPVEYPIIQPLLLASRRSCHGLGNWYLQKGDHHFHFSIFSHDPGWEKGYHSAKGVNHPLFIVQDVAPAGNPYLPEQKSFCTPTADNVLVSTIKKCEDDDSVILRCYEMEGKTTDVSFSWFAPIRRIERTNLIEEGGRLLSGEGKGIRLSVGQYAIETLKIIY